MLKLVHFSAKDFNELIQWIDSETLLHSWSGSLFSYPLTSKSLEWYIADTNQPGESEAFVYKVVDTETDKTIGHISLGGISWKNRSGRITRVFIPKEENGKGYCRQITRLVCKVGFEDLGLHRISLGVYDHNTAAIKCYLAAGFTKEGVQRDIFYYEGNYWSMLEMSMLQSEWTSVDNLAP